MMHPTLTIAMRAAKAAADKLAYVTNNIDVLTAEGDSTSKVVADSLDDAAFRCQKILSNAYENVKIFYSHESTIPTKEDTEYWYVNVLSGSNNFAVGFGHFCVIVSQYKLGKIENTVIVNPITLEEFSASKGRGAQFNDKKSVATKNVKLQILRSLLLLQTVGMKALYSLVLRVLVF